MRPAAPDSGIVFRRLDAGAEIRAGWENTIESSLSTVLSNGEGIRVSTIEHLMAALAGSGIDNAIVELDGPEVPIMDGSAAPFLHLIERAGTLAQDEPRRAVKILKPVAVSDGEATAALLPDHGFSLSFEIDFANPLINRQDMAVTPDLDTFKTELAPARTFGLLDDLPRLQAAGLGRGGSLDNVVVVSGSRVLNHGGLRYADEFVRHKLLDAIGDLYLAGGPIDTDPRADLEGVPLDSRLKLLAAIVGEPHRTVGAEYRRQRHIKWERRVVAAAETAATIGEIGVDVRRLERLLGVAKQIRDRLRGLVRRLHADNELKILATCVIPGKAAFRLEKHWID